MTEEVKDYCRRTGQKVPETLGEIATVIYTSLAECYAKTAKELEEMTGRTYSRIHIVGGGSNAGYLNELTAKATKKEIHAGPGEATAIGNITAQMLKAEEFKTIEEARTIIHESFGVKVYNTKGEQGIDSVPFVSVIISKKFQPGGFNFIYLRRLSEKMNRI